MALISLLIGFAVVCFVFAAMAFVGDSFHESDLDELHRERLGR